MGLLDMFGGSDPQTQGLLGAAAALLGASGPSLVPRSFGQVAAAGIGGYQQAHQQAQEQAQSQLFNSLRLQSLQGELADKEKARQDALGAQDWIRKYNAGGGQNPTAFAHSVLGDDMAPTVANAAKLEASAPRQNATMDLFSRRIQQAQAMRDSGNPLLAASADALEKSALAFQPQVESWKEVQQDGKVMLAPYFKDGSAGSPVPLEVAQKLSFQNTGKQTLALNPTTGATVASFVNTVSPEAALSAATQRRGQDITMRGQDMVDARTREANALAANKDKPPTEFQGKSAAFGLRAKAADQILSDLQGKYSPAAINAKNSAANTIGIGGVLGNIGNSMLSDQSQQADQAQRDFLNATLRQESGAAIAESEFDNARKQYFPQPGDSAAVVAQKAANRQNVIRGFDANAGKAQLQPAAAPAPSKTVTLSDIAATARASGRSTAEVTAALRAKGYTIGGQ